MGAYKKGRVYQRGSIYYIDFNVNGRRIREAIGTNRKLAETVLAKRLTEIAENRFLDIRKAEKILFEVFADEFIRLHSKPNKRSWHCDESNLKALSPFFKGKYLYEITAQDIEQFKSERIKSVKPATVNRELATLKTMLNKAVAWGKLEKSPAASVKFLREPSGRLRYLEIAEINKLITAAPDRIRPIIILAVYTGMRRGEILNLKWTNIDFQRGIIRITSTKNDEVKIVPMNATVKQTLMRIRRHPASPFVFCEKDGQLVKDFRKSFAQLLKDCGIIDFHFHDLRHTYASQLVMSGIDINTTRELLGHKDLRMTLRYAHLSPDYKRHAVDILDARINLKSGTNLAQSQVSEKSENSNIDTTVANTKS